MTPLLQFALTFVTLVVLAVILYLRLMRYEGYMREEKEGIQRLNERLQSLADGLEAVGTKRVEEQLGEIHQTLERIHNSLERSVRLPAPDRAAAAATRPAGGILDVVEGKLYNLGYNRVRVVTDLSEADALEPARVVVEADKDGVTHKGHLIVHGSAVTELEMQPSYTSFP